MRRRAVQKTASGTGKNISRCGSYPASVLGIEPWTIAWFIWIFIHSQYKYKRKTKAQTKWVHKHYWENYRNCKVSKQPSRNSNPVYESTGLHIPPLICAMLLPTWPLCWTLRRCRSAAEGPWRRLPVNRTRNPWTLELRSLQIHQPVTRRPPRSDVIRRPWPYDVIRPWPSDVIRSWSDVIWPRVKVVVGEKETPGGGFSDGSLVFDRLLREWPETEMFVNFIKSWRLSIG